jgi:hypothetical protein
MAHLLDGQHGRVGTHAALRCGVEARERRTLAAVVTPHPHRVKPTESVRSPRKLSHCLTL